MGGQSPDVGCEDSEGSVEKWWVRQTAVMTAVMTVVAPSAPVWVVLLPMAVRKVALDVQVFV